MKAALLIAATVLLIILVLWAGRGGAAEKVLCIGAITRNVADITTAAAGSCPSGALECPRTTCEGPVPWCQSKVGDTYVQGCPRCVDGEFVCDYYLTDPGTWQAGPVGGAVWNGTGFDDEFAQCDGLGDSCKWGSFNSGGRMVSTGRGAPAPAKVTGYRNVSSNGATFIRDAGFDNSGSFDSAGLISAGAPSLTVCEQAALAETTNNGLAVPGAFAYVFDMGTGQCDTYHLQGSMRTQGTREFVKG